MRTILVTGAGFIGWPCLEKLVGQGVEVHALTRTGPCPAGVHAHRLDLMDSAEVANLLAQTQPSHLLHLAWITTPGQYVTSPENLAWVEASLRLLRLFAQNGGRRAVLVGSCFEY